MGGRRRLLTCSPALGALEEVIRPCIKENGTRIVPKEATWSQELVGVIPSATD